VRTTSDGEDGMGYKPYKLVVQTVVQPYKELTDRIFRRGWTTTEQGNPFIITLNSTKFLNPTLLFPWSEWLRRSTLIQLADYSWEVVEHCASYFTKLNYEEEITVSAMADQLWCSLCSTRLKSPFQFLEPFVAKKKWKLKEFKLMQLTTLSSKSLWCPLKFKKVSNQRSFLNYILEGYLLLMKKVELNGSSTISPHWCSMAM
jgi:hypothetical protein